MFFSEIVYFRIPSHCHCTAQMPCACASGLCTTCACGKKGNFCVSECHGGRGLPGNACCLNFKEGAAAAQLGIAEVRKTLAGAGLDCIGSLNELKRRLADYVLQQGGGNGSSSSSGSSSSGSSSSSSSSSSSGASGGGSNVALIKQVVEAADDYLALLSLSGLALTAASPIADLRKAYLKLSIRVHPDKNGGSGEAKLAFQHLVFALERLSQPGGAASGKSAGGGASSAAAAPRQRVDTAALNPRSNEGCVQHKILCPRCGMDWPRKELGLEDAAYNFFMSALKEYSA